MSATVKKLISNTKNNKFAKICIILAAMALLGVLPRMIQSDYMVKVVNTALLYSIIAISSNLLLGFCGQLDFGRSAFCALGAYWSAILSMRLGIPVEIAILSAGFFSMVVGFALGFISKKVGGDFVTLMTIGFNEIVRLLLQNLKDITGGTLGLFGIPSVSLFGFRLATHRQFYYFALVLLVISYILIRRLIRSKMGRAFQAIRDDEQAAAFSGINTGRYKMYCFAIASFFTGIAGAVIAHYSNMATPQYYSLNESLIILVMAVLGGLASLPGSIVGAFILTIVPELSRTFYEYRLLFTGIVLVLLMLFAPDGLLGRNGVGCKIIGLRRFLKKKTEKENVCNTNETGSEHNG